MSSSAYKGSASFTELIRKCAIVDLNQKEPESRENGTLHKEVYSNKCVCFLKIKDTICWDYVNASES